MKQNDQQIGLVALDPWIAPYAGVLAARQDYYKSVRARIDGEGGLLGPISLGYEYFGFNRGESAGEPGLWYREWAPAARALHVIGDFNGWDREADSCERDEYGVWSRFFPDNAYSGRLTHGSLLKVQVTSDLGTMDRIPAYSRRVVQDPSSLDFSAQLWMPP
ncbi:MAG TPA: hypothetical protein VFW40_03810, partial [Capsulimonadaceae bacterium]|nr:hypothetical protein [Capsulimonadaceae bacterium]